MRKLGNRLNLFKFLENPCHDLPVKHTEVTQDAMWFSTVDLHEVGERLFAFQHETQLSVRVDQIGQSTKAYRQRHLREPIPIVNVRNGSKADLRLAPVLDRPAARLGQFLQPVVRVYRDRLVGPFEHRRVAGVVRVEADVRAG
jgi:hypothetical protein